MKNLTLYLNNAKKICDEVGIKYGTIDEIVPNTRAKSRWGQCKRLPNGHFSININASLLEDNVEETSLMNTVVHEVLHTAPNGMQHKNEWEWYAHKVNMAHPELQIKRCTSAEEKGIEVNRTKNVNYIVHCTKCSAKWEYTRWGKVLQNIDRCKCPRCYSKLFIENV